MWYIYIIECSDENFSLYTGITNNLEKRIKAHNDKKGAKYTKGRTPVTLIRFFTVETKSQALRIEYKIKSLPRDKKLSFSLENYLNELQIINDGLN